MEASPELNPTYLRARTNLKRVEGPNSGQAHRVVGDGAAFKNGTTTTTTTAAVAPYQRWPAPTASGGALAQAPVRSAPPLQGRYTMPPGKFVSGPTTSLGSEPGPPRRPSTQSNGGAELGGYRGSTSFCSSAGGTTTPSAGEMGANGPRTSWSSNASAQWATSDSAPSRTITTAPASTDRRGVSLPGPLPGIISMLAPQPGQDTSPNFGQDPSPKHGQQSPRYRNGNNLLGTSALNNALAEKDDLVRQVEMLQSRLMKEEDATHFTQQRSILLEQTDQLLAETDRISVQKEELNTHLEDLTTQRQELSAQVEKIRAHDELSSENFMLSAELREVKSENIRAREEVQAATSDRDERGEFSFKQQSEIQVLRSENQKLSLDVVNLKGRLAERDGQMAQLEVAATSSASLSLEASELKQEIASMKAADTSAASLDEVTRLRREVATLKEQQRSRQTFFDEQQAEAESREALLRASVAHEQQVRIAQAGGGSEGRLRVVMTSQNVPSEDFKSAIGAVEALVNEARREMERAQLRERRAAFEQLGAAIDKADEALLEAALPIARKTGIDAKDIEKGEAKLFELQSMTDEQKAARVARELEMKRKKEAFLLVKKDDAALLQDLLDSLEEGARWMDWRDYAGRTLYKCSQDLRAERVQPVLASRLGMEAPKERASLRDWKAAAAVAQAATAAAQRELRPSIEGRLSDADLVLGELGAVDNESPKSSKSSPTGRTSLTLIGRTSPTGSFSRATIKNLLEFDDVASDSAAEQPVEARAPSVEPSPAPEIMAEDNVENFPVLSEEELQKLKAKALRAVVQDDAATLSCVLESVELKTWSLWQNKAGKDLLTLSEERGSTEAHSALMRATGIVIQLKRDAYEERENVWVYNPGDVQPRRATILEDFDEDAEEILIEYWDGNEPGLYVDRAMIRKDYHNS